MHIIGLVAENVKKIRAVEIEPKGRLIQITGKNGQGKTSVLDAIWYGLVGKRALPEKPVRKGAEKAKIKLDLGELVINRTISSSGAMTLHVESSKGSKFTSPQQVLDELLGELTFDPLAFIHMKTKEQVNALRAVVKIDINVDELNAQSAEDFNKRRDINRDRDRLTAEVNAIVVQAGLPKDKLDESALLQALQTAGQVNDEQRKVDQAKSALYEALSGKKAALQQAAHAGNTIREVIADLERQLTDAKARLKQWEEESARLHEAVTAAEAAYDDAPTGRFVDVSKITADLQQAQLVNREIDKRERRAALEVELKEKTKAADQLTRAMEDREEKKREAVANAKMPVPGLAFDENEVLYNGIPLAQLGEAEQIRISTSIAMAANPKLRILRIEHGEAMDDDALAALAEMAEQHDFQIWMARVDSSGKVGIVMEDGNVKETNEAAE